MQTSSRKSHRTMTDDECFRLHTPYALSASEKLKIETPSYHVIAPTSTEHWRSPTTHHYNPNNKTHAIIPRLQSPPASLPPSSPRDEAERHHCVVLQVVAHGNGQIVVHEMCVCSCHGAQEVQRLTPSSCRRSSGVGNNSKSTQKSHCKPPSPQHPAACSPCIMLCWVPCCCASSAVGGSRAAQLTVYFTPFGVRGTPSAREFRPEFRRSQPQRCKHAQRGSELLGSRDPGYYWGRKKVYSFGFLLTQLPTERKVKRRKAKQSKPESTARKRRQAQWGTDWKNERILRRK